MISSYIISSQEQGIFILCVQVQKKKKKKLINEIIIKLINLWRFGLLKKVLKIYIYISLIEYNKNLTVYAGKKIILYTFHRLVK